MANVAPEARHLACQFSECTFIYDYPKKVINEILSEMHGLPRTSKTSDMVGPLWKYRLLRTFYQNNGSRVKKCLFPINLHFVCALALPSVWGHILICLVCRHSHWRWNEVNIKDQDEKVTNPCQLISIKGQGQGQGSGFAQKAAAIGAWKPMWIQTLDLRVGKCSRLQYCYSTLFVSKLGDDNLDIQCAICSKFVNFYAPGVVKTWGPQHFPVLIPYLPRTYKPVFSNVE